MSKYLMYNIKNIQPIKLSTTLNQTDNEFTRSYLSGAAIRGAYISEYIKYNKVTNLNEGVHRDKILKGRIQFFNAYPLAEGVRSYPMPKCFYTEKDDKNYYDSMKLIFGPKQDYEKVKNCEFVFIKNDELETVKIDKQNSLHIRTPRNDENTKIYRYESIAPHNEFIGIIRFTGEDAEDDREECIRILSHIKYIYIGGAKSSGYGLCEITNIEKKDNNPESEYFDDEVFKATNSYTDNGEKKRIYLYALSDIIFRDKNGIYKPYIDKNAIEEGLNIKNVKLIDSYCDTETFTGFNNKWGYRLPLVSGIKAGSVFVYEYTGDIDRGKAELFIDGGIGDRKAEGFGHFIISDHFNFKSIKIKKKSSKRISMKTLNGEERNQMQLILDRIYKKKLEDVLTKKVIELDEDLENSRAINHNQWGRLLRLTEILETMNNEEVENKVNEYFIHINTKVNNRDLANKLKRVEINKKNVEQYIKDFLSDTDIEDFEYYTNVYRFAVGGIESSLDRDYILKYKIRMLKELFRLQLKNTDKEDEEYGA